MGADDPALPDGTLVMVSPTGAITHDNQEWRAVRTLSGDVGWVQASALRLAGVLTQLRPAAPGASPTPTATQSADHQMRVAHTDGEGVVLRASPSLDDRTPRGFMDGTVVTVLERSGTDWLHVRGSNGQEGWIPAQYVQPAT
jgi:SH3-like domain-containing protein